jgi:curved DNA-binding protein
MDYYKILGVTRNSTDDDIKQAYRKLAAKHHPDRSGGDTAKFQEIQQAYDAISTAEKRAESDRQSHSASGFPGGFPGGFTFNMNGDPLNEIFERMFRQANGQRQSKTQTFRTIIWVSLEQIYNGGEQHLKLQTQTNVQMVKIDIPKGISDGAQLRYDNLIPDGVLIVEFRTYNHLKFERRGNDLHMQMQISVLDLIVGTMLEVVTINDKKLEVHLPPYTQPTAALKITGAGLPLMNSPLFGDLYLNIKPFTPTSVSDDVFNAIQASKSTSNP